MTIGKKIFIISLFLMPFFQGLYFYHEIFITMSFLLLFLMFFCFLQKGLYVEKSTTTFFLLALFLCYLITCIYGIDRGMSFIGALKVLPYLIFYLIYTQVYTKEFKEQLLTTLMYSALVAAVLGILAFLIPQLSELLIQKGRLGGVFQYANTYGLYCLVGILLVIRRPEKGFFEVWSIAILVITTILTFSRSIILMGLIVIIVGILFERKHFFYHVVGVTSGGLIAFTLIKVLNLNQISSRLGDTSTQTGEWLTRLVYYKDALKMIAKFPFGTGYMGFSFIERTYQTSATYQVKFVHSNLLQYTLDIGILGASLCCLFLLIQLFSRKIDFILKLVLITITLHGLIDFDFEFPYILMMLLVVIGINEEKRFFISKGHAFQISFIACLLGIYLYMIMPTTLSFEGNYEKAVGYYPIYTEAQLKELSQIKGINEAGAELAHHIIDQNPYSVEAFAYLRDFYFKTKSYDLAKVAAEKTMWLNPLNINHVEIYSTILIECSKEAMGQGEKSVAKQDIDLLQGIPLYLEKLAKERISDYNIKHVPKLEMTEVLLNNQNKANQLTIEMDQ